MPHCAPPGLGAGQVVPSNPVPPPDSVDAPPRLAELSGRPLVKVRHRYDALGTETPVDALVDAGQISQGQVEEWTRQFRASQDREPVGLAEPADDLGDEPVGRDADRTGERADAVPDCRLDVAGDPFGHIAIALIGHELAPALVHRVDRCDMHRRFDRFDELVVDLDIPSWAGADIDHIGTELPCVTKPATGLDAESTRLIAGSNAAPRRTGRGRDDHRAAPKFGIVHHLDASEVAVEIDEHDL